MRRVLNVLGSVVLVLSIALARGFVSLLKRPKKSSNSSRSGFRLLLGLWGLASVAFAALGLWTLANAGYLPVALLLAVVVGALLRMLRMRIQDHEKRED